jgi:2-C-methyl-D-erythritol 2,4-cyclodiphosphate synthase
MNIPTCASGRASTSIASATDPDRVMVLGGCHFDGVIRPGGHSDADVVAHACADALLGAAGLGDIGMHFPDTDERWEGADSMALLRHVAAMLAEDGWRASNIDCAVVCERPKIAPYRDEMQRNLTAAVGAPVTVKGNRAEQLGRHRTRRGRRLLRHGADPPIGGGNDVSGVARPVVGDPNKPSGPDARRTAAAETTATAAANRRRWPDVPADPVDGAAGGTWQGRRREGQAGRREGARRSTGGRVARRYASC